MFEAFDQPNLVNSTDRRNRTTIAPQALLMLNHPLVRRASGELDQPQHPGRQRDHAERDQRDRHRPTPLPDAHRTAATSAGGVLVSTGVALRWSSQSETPSPIIAMPVGKTRCAVGPPRRTVEPSSTSSTISEPT